MLVSRTRGWCIFMSGITATTCCSGWGVLQAAFIDSDVPVPKGVRMVKNAVLVASLVGLALLVYEQI